MVNVSDSGTLDGDLAIAIGDTGLSMSLVSAIDTLLGTARAFTNLGINAALVSGAVSGDMACASAGRALRMRLGLVAICLGRLRLRLPFRLCRLRLLRRL